MKSLGPQGRWRINGVIGSGGFSTVYSAIDTRFESPVAVKVLAEALAANLDIRQRFLSEALLLRRNPGPVVPVYDTGETSNGQPFIVMPLADGGDLGVRIERWRSVAEPNTDDVLGLAQILSHVLVRLHDAGIVHRDLKPSNLLIFGAQETSGDAATRIVGPLIAAGETVLLSDLGFAKDLAKNSGLTVGGGTPGYLPPEQRQVGQVDQRADIWAASAIMYWFLVGYSPSDSSRARREALAATPFASLTDAIEIGLSDDPGQRPASIGDWCRNFERVLDDGRATSSPSQLRPSLRVVVTVASLLVGAVVGFGAATLGGLVGETAETVPYIGVETSRVESGDISASIAGPNVIRLGSTASYTAEVDADVFTWDWISPAGNVQKGGSTLEIEPSSVGVGTVTLVATTETGEQLRVAIDIEVVS